MLRPLLLEIVPNACLGSAAEVIVKPEPFAVTVQIISSKGLVIVLS